MLFIFSYIFAKLAISAELLVAIIERFLNCKIRKKVLFWGKPMEKLQGYIKLYNVLHSLKKNCY